MNKLALALAIGTTLLASAASTHAYDSDPGYGHSNYGRQVTTQRTSARYQPIYYRPVQRYYGKGYTIAYNYVPVSRQTMRPTTDYEPQNLNIPANKIAAYGVRTPRIAYSTAQSGTRLVAKRPAVKVPTVAEPVAPAPAEPLPVAAGPEPR